MSAELERLKAENELLRLEIDGLWKILGLIQECVTGLDDMFVTVELTKAKMQQLRDRIG